jgi:transcriptional regulator with GAF, ATPase, and Fis domain
MGVPLLSGDELVGLIGLSRYHVTEFTHQDVHVSGMFAVQVAASVCDVQRYQAARDRVTELSLLNEILYAATSSLDLDMLLERAIEVLVDTFRLAGAGVALLGASGTGLVLRAQQGLSSALVKAVERMSADGNSLYSNVIVSRRSVLSISGVGDGRKEESPSAVYVPLDAGDAALGLLIAQARPGEHLSRRQLALLKTVSPQICRTVERVLQGS